MILKIDAEQRVIYLIEPISLDELLGQLELIDYEGGDWLLAPDMTFNFSRS